jgi:hypothetical protein
VEALEEESRFVLSGGHRGDEPAGDGLRRMTLRLVLDVRGGRCGCALRIVGRKAGGVDRSSDGEAARTAERAVTTVDAGEEAGPWRAWLPAVKARAGVRDDARGLDSASILRG